MSKDSDTGDNTSITSTSTSSGASTASAAAEAPMNVNENVIQNANSDQDGTQNTDVPGTDDMQNPSDGTASNAKSDTGNNVTDDDTLLSKVRENMTVKGKSYFKTVRYELFKYKRECVFRCLKCNTMDKTQKAINEHFKTTHGTLTCGACDKVCNTMSAFHKHAYEHSDRAKIFTCKDCDKGFPFMSQLKAHRKVHLMALKHHCIKCNKSYKNKGELIKHCNLHAHMHKHGPSNRYQCTNCNKSFKYYMQYKCHGKCIGVDNS